MRTGVMMAIFLMSVTILSFAQTSRQKVARLADLPRFQYSISGKVEDLVKSESAFRAFASQVRNNVESVLRDYDIEDASAKRDLLSILVSLDILENRDDSAGRRLAEVKGLEEKPAARALSGLSENAVRDARPEVPDHNSPAYRKAVSAAGI